MLTQWYLWYLMGHLVSLMIVCSRRLLLLSSVARYRDLNGHVHCPVGVAFVTC